MSFYDYALKQKEHDEAVEIERATKVHSCVGEITDYIKSTPINATANDFISTLYVTGIINEQVYTALLNSDAVDELACEFCDKLERLIAITMVDVESDEKAKEFDEVA